MPLSPGLVWTKRDDQYVKRTMIQGVSRGQIEWLMWLQTTSACIDANGKRHHIHHAYYQGEFEVDGKPVDGYVKIDGVETFFEYLGCFYHPGCCVPDTQIKNAEQKAASDRAKQDQLKSRGRLVVMRECKWKEMKRRMAVKPETEMGRILLDDNESSLLKAIREDQVYGFIIGDVKTPDDVIESFGSFLFPPLVRRFDVKHSMLSSYMMRVCEEEGISINNQPPTLIQTYHGEQVMMLTTMAKLFMNRGIQISNVTKFVQYIPGRALHPFVAKVVGMRTEAKQSGDEAKSLTAKLYGNSSYGKMGESVERYRSTSIHTDDGKVVAAKRSALFRNSDEIVTEGGRLVGHEISKLNSTVNDNKPVHLAVAILQNAKLLFLR